METIFKDQLFAPTCILFNKYITELQRKILIFIINSSKDGICRGKQKEIADFININYGTLRTNLWMLRRDGYIKDIDKGLGVFVDGKQIILSDSFYEDYQKGIGR